MMDMDKPLSGVEAAIKHMNEVVARRDAEILELQAEIKRLRAEVAMLREGLSETVRAVLEMPSAEDN